MVALMDLTVPTSLPARERKGLRRRVRDNRWLFHPQPRRQQPASPPVAYGRLATLRERSRLTTSCCGSRRRADAPCGRNNKITFVAAAVIRSAHPVSPRFNRRRRRRRRRDGAPHPATPCRTANGSAAAAAAVVGNRSHKGDERAQSQRGGTLKTPLGYSE